MHGLGFEGALSELLKVGDKGALSSSGRGDGPSPFPTPASKICFRSSLRACMTLLHCRCATVAWGSPHWPPLLCVPRDQMRLVHDDNQNPATRLPTRLRALAAPYYRLILVKHITCVPPPSDVMPSSTLLGTACLARLAQPTRHPPPHPTWSPSTSPTTRAPRSAELLRLPVPRVYSRPRRKNLPSLRRLSIWCRARWYG